MSARPPVETRKVRTQEVGAMMRAGWTTGCTIGDGLVLMTRPQRLSTETDWRDAKIAALEAELAQARTKLAAAELRIESLERRVLPPDLDATMKAITDAFGISRDELLSRSRGSAVSQPRQAYFLLAWERSRRDKATIAASVGRDYTTILYGIDRAKALRDHDAEFAARYSAAEARLGARS